MSERTSFPTVVGALALATLLYALSHGPAWRIVKGYPETGRAFYSFYAPLIWLGVNSLSWRAVSEAYCVWCHENL